jgi:hypothetical protein
MLDETHRASCRLPTRTNLKVSKPDIRVLHLIDRGLHTSAQIVICSTFSSTTLIERALGVSVLGISGYWFKACLRELLSSVLPTHPPLSGPDIHAHLPTPQHRQTRMHGPLVANPDLSAFRRQQVHPKHRTSLHRPKRQSILPRLVTVNPLAPLLLSLRLLRRVRSARRPNCHSWITEHASAEAFPASLGTRRIQKRKPGPTADDVVADLDVCEKASQSVAAVLLPCRLRRTREPVGVLVVLLAGAVLDQLQRLDVGWI